jgi:putative peptidoglycan lipid II flippase
MSRNRYLLLDKFILVWRQWRNRSHSRQIFAAAVSVGIVALLVKFLFMLKELFVAYKFGRADVLDAYIIAYALPAFLINFFASINGSAFVPTFLRVATQRDHIQAQHFLSGVLTWNIMVSLIICAMMWMLAAPIMKMLGSGFTPEKLVLTQDLFMILVPAVLLGGVITTASALLRASEVFHAPVLSPLFTSVAITAALFLFDEALGVYALAVGTLLGLTFEIIFLARRAAILNWRLYPGWHWKTKDRQLYIRYIAPLAGGVLLMGSLELVDNSMASMLESGSVSALSYGTRVSLAVMGMSSIALGTVVLPRFSRLVVAQEWHEIRKIVRTFNRLIVIASIPVVAAIVLFSEELIGIIYQRGAFTTEDTHLVSQVQSMHILQLPFYLMGILCARVISAAGKNQWLLIIAALSLMLNIAGNYLLMKLFGVAGIALATTIVVCFSWLMLNLLVTRMIYKAEAAH